jgi:hypothetical protein
MDALGLFALQPSPEAVRGVIFLRRCSRRGGNNKISHEETKSTKIFLFSLRALRFFVADFPQED